MQTLESALNNQLQGLIKKAQKIVEINTLLKTLLDPEIAAHCSAVNLEKGTLIIMTDSAAFGTRVRFQKESLLLALQDQFKEIKDIRCKVNP